MRDKRHSILPHKASKAHNVDLCLKEMLSNCCFKRFSTVIVSVADDNGGYAMSSCSLKTLDASSVRNYEADLCWINLFSQTCRY